MLLHALCLQGVLEEELRKDARAYPPRGLGQGGDHQVLDRLNQIVEVRTHEPPIDQRTQAVEHVGLRRRSRQVGFYNGHQGLELRLGQILVGGIGPDELGRALEEGVEEVRVH